MLLQRPIAGSQVPFCPLEKKVPDSWSRVEPCTFKVRGPTYLRLENWSHILNPDVSLKFLYKNSYGMFFFFFFFAGIKERILLRNMQHITPLALMCFCHLKKFITLLNMWNFPQSITLGNFPPFLL